VEQHWDEGIADPLVFAVMNRASTSRGHELTPRGTQIDVDLITEEQTLIPHRQTTHTQVAAATASPRGPSLEAVMQRTKKLDFVQVPLLANGLPTGPDATTTIRWRYEAYNAAVDVRDGALAAALVSSETARYYERSRWAALSADRATLESMPLGQRLTALMLRHASSRDELERMDGADVIAFTIRAGWTGGSTGLEVRAVRIEGDVAHVLHGDDEVELELPLFVRERGEWLQDLAPMLELAEPLLAESLAELADDQNEALVKMLSLIDGHHPGDDIWTPLIAR
jgi:hypothetical protein